MAEVSDDKERDDDWNGLQQSHNIDSPSERKKEKRKKKLGLASLRNYLGFSKMPPTLPKVNGKQVNEQEKLYILLLSNDLSYWFNHLVYGYNVCTIEDLRIYLQSKQSKALVSQLYPVVVKSQSANYQTIVKHMHVEPNTYMKTLQRHSIRIIDRSEITIHHQMASRIYVGLYKGVWTRSNGTQVEVCLRYAEYPSQVEKFIAEAKLLANHLKHDNILQLYGAVIFGQYADSLALVLEFAPRGSLLECFNRNDVITVHSIYRYACQIVTVLDYLVENTINIQDVRMYTLFVFDDRKIKFGGFQNSLIGSSEIISSPNVPELVGQYGEVLLQLYNNLPYRWPHNPNHHEYRFPNEMILLRKRCMFYEEEQRPTLKEIMKVLEQFPPLIVTANSQYEAKQTIEISLKKGENITVISQDTSKYVYEVSPATQLSFQYVSDMWLGQKDDGTFGCFPKYYVDRLDDTTSDNIPAEIMARGPEAEHAYRKALLEGKVQVYRGRIMLIGQDRAGKTSLKKSLLGIPFNTDEPSTDGIEVDPSTFEVDVEQVSSWQRLHDITQPGSQSERAIAKLIAEDLSRDALSKEDARSSLDENPFENNLVKNRQVPEAMEEAPHDLQEHQAAAASEDDSSRSSLNEEVNQGSQPTLESPATSYSTQVKLPEELARLVAEYLKGGLASSAQPQKETVLDLWDFAGQHLYYATHPVFFSSRAIYVLTHNLSKNLRERAEPCSRQGVHTIKLDNANNETNLENLISWLVTIHGIENPKGEAENQRSSATGSQMNYLRPPVVIVGTHADKAKQPIEEVRAQLSEAIFGKTYDEHVLRPFVAVDNTQSAKDPGIQQLKNTLAHLLDIEPYMGETLPAKWFNFEKAIKDQIENKVYYMTVEDVHCIAKSECLITDPDEVNTMLTFYHDLRVIVKHAGTVVLQSQWLIDLFRSLVTIRSFTDMDPAHAKHWKTLEETGVLHKTLIDHVFGRLVENQSAQEDLLSMMERYGLIAKFSCSVKAADGGTTECVEYFVPAQLTSSPESLVKASPGLSDPCPLLIHFPDGFVPHGLFQQLVSRLIFQFSEMGFSQRPNLFRNGVRFVIGCDDGCDLYLICCKRHIKVMLCTLAAPKTHMPFGNCLAIQVRMLLEDTLEDLSREWDWLRGMRTELCVECRACVSSEDGCENHGKIGCPDDECVHVVRVCEQPLVCNRVFGIASRFTLPGLRRWFTEDEKAAECVLKTGKPSTEDLTLLARDIGSLWKRLGRALGLDEPELEQLETDERHLYERCYGVLRRWTEIHASAATYESLGRALQHQTVLRRDLALKYCGIVQP